MKFNAPIPDGEVLRIVYVGFDSTENHNPSYEKSLGVVVGHDGVSASSEAREWLNAQPDPPTYKGYDGETYPQFKIVAETVLRPRPLVAQEVAPDPFDASPQQRTLEAGIIASKLDLGFWKPSDVKILLGACTRYTERNR